jgi:hypothetical protein
MVIEPFTRVTIFHSAELQCCKDYSCRLFPLGFPKDKNCKNWDVGTWEVTVLCWLFCRIADGWSNRPIAEWVISSDKLRPAWYYDRFAPVFVRGVLSIEQRVFIVESFAKKKLTENVSVSFVVNILARQFSQRRVYPSFWESGGPKVQCVWSVENLMLYS